jgi:hypothetical protein
VDFHGLWVTSDGSLILVRELDERLGFGDLIAQHLTDSRHGNTTASAREPAAPARLQAVSQAMGLSSHAMTAPERLLLEVGGQA